MPTAPRARRVEIRRVYDDTLGRGVHRVLVDRLWPRGIAKADAPIDEWVKDVAPSTELRRWYGHEPEKFAEFATRYKAELKVPPTKDAVARLRAQATRTRVALMTATRDVDHSGAQVLLGVLNKSR
ncbi:MAG TPA: DUF488 family protein [Acidimicrobiales bacterium]